MLDWLDKLIWFTWGSIWASSNINFSLGSGGSHNSLDIALLSSRARASRWNMRVSGGSNNLADFTFGALWHVRITGITSRSNLTLGADNNMRISSGSAVLSYFTRSTVGSLLSLGARDDVWLSWLSLNSSNFVNWTLRSFFGSFLTVGFLDGLFLANLLEVHHNLSKEGAEFSIVFVS